MSRDLVHLPVPPGPEGVARVLPALAAALAGSGPAIAPVPTPGPAAPTDVVAAVLRAVAADGPPLESDDVAAVVATSGSTGAPKGVLLTAANLTALTAAVQGVDGRPQWVAALPLTSMGGLNVAVRALAADREPIAVASLAGASTFTAADFAAAVARAAAVTDDVRTAIVPTQLARLVDDPDGADALRRCRQVLVGGAALRPGLRARARDLGITVVSTYGATETAGGCVFDGRPLPGVRIEADGDGRLAAFGPCVATGYRADPAATAAAFRAGGFRLPDLGQVAADGTVTVTGRVDDVVVVRGVNVATTAVEAVLADRPGVRAAAVVAVPGPDGEPRLAGYVTGAGVDLDAAGAAVVAALGPAARTRLWALATLPLLPGGKVDRVALRSAAARSAGS